MVPSKTETYIRFCLSCLAEWIGHRTDVCPRCTSWDHMAISCFAQEANERQAAEAFDRLLDTLPEPEEPRCQDCGCLLSLLSEAKICTECETWRNEDLARDWLGEETLDEIEAAQEGASEEGEDELPW